MICSGRSTERCTWLSTAICLMPKYQVSTSWWWRPTKRKQHSLACVHFGGQLDNRVLKDFGCLNPLKRECKSTTISIQNLSRKLLPEFDTAAVLDEWKLYQNDDNISDNDTDQRVDHYWNAVFLLKSVEGNGRYQLLPRLVKWCLVPGLVLAQANVNSERSLLLNARVVTKERSRFGEQTIVGLQLLKDAVNCRPEKSPVIKEMKKSVRLAYSAYKARLDEEKEEKKKELEETKRKKED